MQTLADRTISVDREHGLAKQLDRAIMALQRGEPLQNAARANADLASLLGVAESLIERGQSRRQVVKAPRMS